MAGYILAVDFGTTRSAGATLVGDTVEVLEFGDSRYLPSVVVVDDEGRLVAGRSARKQAYRVQADRVAFTPKREVGRESVLLGGRPFRPAELVAAVVGQIAAEAARRFNGAPPERLVLAHPARWAEIRLGVLREAAKLAGLPEPELVAEPVAAAMAYAQSSAVPEGGLVAIYDLGGGTLDLAVLRRTAGGFDVCGPPGGDEELGGEVFDDWLAALVGEYAAEQDRDGWDQLSTGGQRRGSWARFRDRVREAKEALSEEDRTNIFVPDTAADISVTRAEFEELVRADIDHSVALLEATVADAGRTAGDLAAVYLTGGAAQIPLVERAISARLGIPIERWGDPKAVVAHGAARCASHTSASTIRDPRTGLEWAADLSPQPMSFDAAQRYVADLHIDAVSGWRLPTKEELESIVDWSRVREENGLLEFNHPLREPFNAQRAGYLHSSTPVPAPHDGNFIMLVSNANIFNGKGMNAYVRAVRGEEWTVVRDPATGIEWTAALSTDPMSFADARQYVSTLRVGGATGWRLPTMEELESIVDPARMRDADGTPRGSHPLREPFNVQREGFLHSSTPGRPPHNGNYLLAVETGNVFDGEGIPAFVRAVRRAWSTAPQAPEVSSTRVDRRTDDSRPPRRGADVTTTVTITPARAASGTLVYCSLPSGESTRIRCLQVPPGTRDGYRMRLRGEGELGEYGAPPGDLYVQFRLASDAGDAHRAPPDVNAARRSSQATPQRQPGPSFGPTLQPLPRPTSPRPKSPLSQTPYSSSLDHAVPPESAAHPKRIRPARIFGTILTAIVITLIVWQGWHMLTPAPTPVDLATVFPGIRQDDRCKPSDASNHFRGAIQAISCPSSQYPNDDIKVYYYQFDSPADAKVAVNEFQDQHETWLVGSDSSKTPQGPYSTGRKPDQSGYYVFGGYDNLPFAFEVAGAAENEVLDTFHRLQLLEASAIHYRG